MGLEGGDILIGLGRGPDEDSFFYTSRGKYGASVIVLEGENFVLMALKKQIRRL